MITLFTLQRLLRVLMSSLLLTLVAMACTSTKVIEKGDFSPSDAEAGYIVSQLPDYSSTLHTLKGKGKALVSEPGNTERVTVYFASTRDKSRVTVKSGIGIEGGQLLTDGDSLLIYNKIDKFARKVAIKEGNLTRIDNLASLNILEMLTFTVVAKQVEQVLENPKFYLLLLQSGAKIYVNKDTYRVKEVMQPRASALPYSKIEYDAYSKIEKFMLPRRITIFSSDEKSRINLLIQSLQINPKLEELTIGLPENITIYHQ